MIRTILIVLLSLLLAGTVAAQSHWLPVEPQFDSLNIELEEIYHQSDFEQRQVIISSMYDIANRTGNPVLLSRAKYWDVKTSLSTNMNMDMDMADTLINDAISLLDTTIYKYDYACLMLLKAGIQNAKANYTDAYLIYENNIPYFKGIKDTLSLATIYVNKGILMQSLGEIEEALSFFQMGDNYLKDPILAKKNKLNISNIMFELRENTSSVYSMLEQLIEDPAIKQDIPFLINVMLTLYANASDEAKQFQYSEEAYRLALTYGDSKLLSLTLINKGNKHLLKNETDSSVYYHRQAYDMSLKQHDIEVAQLASLGLYTNYEKQSKPDSALRYLQEYVTYSDSLATNEKMMEIKRIQAQTAIDNHREQMRLVAEKANSDKRRNQMTTLFLLTLALLVCVLLWYRWKRMRTEKIIKELENRELNRQLENEKLQSDNFRMEIDFKNRELTTHTLMLNEKNNILKEIKKEVKALTLNEGRAQKERKQLEKRIDEHLKNDEEWEYVKQHFESVHPNFFLKLKSLAPNLSESDLRLCVYVHMGIPSKQIARLLSVLPGSVNMNRYRIRKKLELEGDTGLEDFLRTL